MFCSGSFYIFAEIPLQFLRIISDGIGIESTPANINQIIQLAEYRNLTQSRDPCDKYEPLHGLIPLYHLIKGFHHAADLFYALSVFQIICYGSVIFIYQDNNIFIILRVQRFDQLSEHKRRRAALDLNPVFLGNPLQGQLQSFFQY